MGTRNLTMVIHEKKPVVAQYGQWDGYPAGQGVTVLEFLKNSNIIRFKEQLKKVRFGNDEDDKKMKEFLKSIGSNGSLNMDQAAKYTKEYPYLSRDHGAEILNMIYESEDQEIHLHDSSNFAADSLFCEWAYVVDLDKKVLEVYQGFNKRKLGKNQRFANLEKHEYGLDGYNYYPIRCIKKYKFSELPDVETFCKECDEDYE